MLKETIVVDKPFEYTPSQITLGIARSKEQLSKFRQMLDSPDDACRTAAEEAVPAYEKALAVAQTKSPSQMIGDLRTLYDSIERLEKASRTEEEIEDYLWDYWKDPVIYYRDILNEGWIEKVFQRVATASMRHMNDKN